MHTIKVDQTWVAGAQLHCGLLTPLTGVWCPVSAQGVFSGEPFVRLCPFLCVQAGREVASSDFLPLCVQQTGPHCLALGSPERTQDGGLLVAPCLELIFFTSFKDRGQHSPSLT